MIPKRILQFFTLLSALVFLAGLTQKTWGTDKENHPEPLRLILADTMTVSDFQHFNKLPTEIITRIFNIRQLSDTIRSLKSYGLSENALSVRTKVVLSEFREEHSRNPFRFTLHFVVAILFLGIVFILIRKSLISPSCRKYLYFISLMIFGLGFNSSPSPMGPLNDTISLLGNWSEILHPRLWAILTYLLLVIVANKFICSWACQFGVLQDLIFRLNRNSSDNKALVRQYKLPFTLSNSFRVFFFFVTVFISVCWAVNIIDIVNPFTIFNGMNGQIAGWTFIGAILSISLFIYRPWCSLFCPFGLLGWLFEKISIYKIRVNANTCTECNDCVEACPSDAMKAILENKSNLPDCFSCGSCINECPNGSIRFGR
jgi:polyferredoxin